MNSMNADRRQFLTTAATAMLAAGVGIRRAAAAEDGITTDTIAAAEKLLGLNYTEDERRQIAESIAGQVQAASMRQQLALDVDLQPASVFDPRLPGVDYPAQGRALRLAGRQTSELPASEADIAFASVTEQSHWISSGQISSRRLTEIYLDRIERYAPGLHCYITVTRDRALAEAERADRELRDGNVRGPLHGIPYGLKDVFDTAGIPTTWGSAVYRDRVPGQDAAVASMLSEAGAVLLGKHATGELANGATWFGGTCRNPWNTEEAAGGSSTGAGAATAAGLCSFAIGTDSLGSILNPADRCGVTGLRPTFGRVPIRGGMPLTPSLERIGPLTRSVEDAALILSVINGPDPTSAASIDWGFDYDAHVDLREVTVGWSPAWFESMGMFPGAEIPAGQSHQAALQALRDLGVNLVEIDWPQLPYGLLMDIVYLESAAIFEELTLDGRDEQVYSADAWSWPNGWRRIHLMSAVDYLQRDRFRRKVMQAMHALFQQVDLLFAPTYGSFEMLMTMNFTGNPGLSLRSGFGEAPTRSLAFAPADAAGPLHRITENVSFHGRLFEEGKMLAVARALEAELGVWREPPPGFG